MFTRSCGRKKEKRKAEVVGLCEKMFSGIGRGSRGDIEASGEGSETGLGT